MEAPDRNILDHKVLYATLLGRVDEAITYLERMAAEQTFDWFHTAHVTELLKAALLEAEEQYMEAAEEVPRLIVLPLQDQERGSPFGCGKQKGAAVSSSEHSGPGGWDIGKLP